MANTYKTDVVTLNAANTDFTILTASASTTLVKNITWVHDDHNTNVKLALTKSGSSKVTIGEFTATANQPEKIWTDILPLEANDVLHLQSDHISGSDVGYCIISYVISTASVAGQSIAVHTDVDITDIDTGEALIWNDSTTQFEPGTPGTTLTDTNDLTEGSTNLYYTEARVSANTNVAANTLKIATVADDPSPQLGQHLDVQAREINTSTTNGNITVVPNGTGVLLVKGATASAAVTLNCESNTHGVTIQAPPHSANATYTLTLPTSDGSNGQYMTTDGSGNLAFETFVLPDLAVGTDNIQDDSVTADHILDDTVGADELANTTVTAGTYTNTNITVDAQGRLTAASSGVSGGSTLTAVTGTLPIVSSGGNAPAISINAATASAAGSMSAAHFQYVNTSSGTYDDTGTKESKDIVLTVDAGISGADELIVSCMQDTTADNTNSNAKDLLGVSKGANSQVVLRGIIELTSLIDGATAGRPLWLGTSGQFQSAAPTADDSYSRIVGHSLGTTASGALVYFNPSPDWVQIDNP